MNTRLLPDLYVVYRYHNDKPEFLALEYAGEGEYVHEWGVTCTPRLFFKDDAIRYAHRYDGWIVQVHLSKVTF